MFIKDGDSQMLNPKLIKQGEYWLKKLSGYTGRTALFPGHRLEEGETAREEIPVVFPGVVNRRLLELSKESDLSIFIILLACLQVLIYRYSSNPDITVISPVYKDHRTDRTRGDYLYICDKVRGNQSFKELVLQTRKSVLDAYENQDYPVEELITEFWDRSNLVPVMQSGTNIGCVFENIHDRVAESADHSTGKLRGLLVFSFLREGKRLEGHISYESGLYKRFYLEQAALHFTRLLGELVLDVDQEISGILLLSEGEKQHLIFDFNKTCDGHFPVCKSLRQLFEERVHKMPDRIAIVHENEALSFKELNKKANRLARVLKNEGVSGDQPIGILSGPAAAFAASILAVWKACCMYVPIDYNYPPQRITGILSDLNASFVISGTAGMDINAGLANFYHGKIIDLDKYGQRIDSESGENLAHQDPGDMNRPAYIIFTSGSTGKPKGAGVYQHGLFNLLDWFVSEFDLDNHDRNLLMTSLSFDLTQKNILAPLVTGGTLYIPDLAYFEPGVILREIREKKITWFNCTPGMVYQLVEFSEEDEIKQLASLRYIFLGGETISVKKMLKWLEREDFSARVVNTYGPTECTDICAYYCLKEPANFLSAPLPLGKPIYNACLFVLSQGLELLPVGVSGELFIGGQGIGTGYINAVEMTGKKFRRVSFQGAGVMCLYSSGDLARWLPDGNLEFLGRKDYQVKVRGFRIELQEIESHLLDHKDIKEAIVIDRQRAGGEKYLCAYVIPGSKTRETWDSSQLRGYLSAVLPGYMIPAYFVQLGEIPLNPNGKLDRKALPDPDEIVWGKGDKGEVFAPAENEIQEKLVKVWQEVLGLESGIGIDDNFFDLGGDSLLSIQVLAHIREEVGIEVPLRRFFEKPTIKELSREFAGGKGGVRRIPCAPPGAVIPLSFAQEGLWYLQQLDQHSTAYHVPRVIRIKGELDVNLVEGTFAEITRRHEILRTVFITVDGQPVQRIRKSGGFKLPVIDLVDGSELLETQTRDEFISRWLREEGQRPFDFEKGPMIRITLLKLSAVEHLLVLTQHHLIHDGWTQGVLLKEFKAVFTAYCEGKESPLPPLLIQYGDFAYWQRNYLQGEVLENRLGYWKKKLSGLAPLLNLPLDRPRPPVISGRGKEKRLFLSRPLSDALVKFNREKEVTLFMTMLTVLKILLYRYTGTGDLCIGTGAANRDYKEMEGMLGMVINTLALRTPLSGELTVETCLQRVKTTCLEAYEYEDTPFEKVVEVLRPERSLSYMPIFQVMFSFMDTPAYSLQLPGLELQVEEAHNRSAKFDINIIVEPPSGERREDTGSRVEILWEYNTDIFNDTTMEQMLRHYNQLLKESTSHPGKSISLLPMLEQREIKQLVYDFNNTRVDYPKNKLLPLLFREQVERTPDHIAVVGVHQLHLFHEKGTTGPAPLSDLMSITYKELNRKSNQLAHMLKEKGVQPDTIVGIMVERSVLVAIGLLGILKAGGAYLPIDPRYPGERRRYMMKDGHIDILLTDSIGSTNDQKDFNNAGKVIQLDDSDIFITHEGPKVERGSGWNSLAYIMYTSGSTGKPKGVMVQHRNVVRLVKNTNYVEFKENRRILQTGALEFDASTFEIWGALLNGLTLYLIDKDQILNPEQLKEAIKKYHISTIWMTSPLFNHMVQADVEIFAGLIHLLVGGDALSPSHINRVKTRFPALKLINGYGPTENTTFSTTFLIDKEYTNIPIGSPIANSTAIIIDKTHHLQPVKAAGELCVGGEGVSRGYLNDPELTNDKFFDKALNSLFLALRRTKRTKNLLRGRNQPGEFQEIPGAGRQKLRAIFYKTGDLARWLPDGNIEFLGRIDNQVKIRGFRVELGEIESQLLSYKHIKEAVVQVRDGNGGDNYLCAYVVYEAEEPADVVINEAELRKYLTLTLPGYMVPTYFVQLDKLPLTANGKIDRRALPAPGIKIDASYQAPRNPMEKKLVELWAEVLGVENDKISIHHNFFALGGHSLNATIMSAKVHRVFHVRLPLGQVFKTPNIRELSLYLKNARQDRYASVEPVEKKEYYPLSSAQKRLYILQQMELSGTAYNIPLVYPLESDMDVQGLETVFRQLMGRHESLRTSFEMVNQEPVQRIWPKDEVLFAADCMEIPGESKDDDKSSVELFITDNSRAFDLEQAPLLKVLLVKTSQGHQLLLMDMHHIISDGTSMEVLKQEFISLYQGDSLPGLRIQYKDYSEWQNSKKQKEILKDQEAYWIRLFSDDIPVLELPTDYPRPTMRSFEGNSMNFVLEGQEYLSLREIITGEKVTLYMFILSVFNIFLCKLSGQEDIIIGTPTAGRRHADIERIIGMFVNTLAMRNYPSAEKPFKEFLSEVKDHSLEAFENQEYQFEELVDKLKVPHDMSRNPLFDVMFGMIDRDDSRTNQPGGHEHENAPEQSSYIYLKKTVKFDLVLNAVDLQEKLLFNIKYSTKLFEASTIDRMIGYYKQLISSIIDDPSREIASIEIITGPEKNQLLYDFNCSESDYRRDKLIHQLFEEQVERTPDNIALHGCMMAWMHGEEGSITYRELNEKSNFLAHKLKDKGIEPDTIVGIMLKRSIEMIVGILGILKYGGAYLPIDPFYPEERTRYILADSGMKILVNDVSDMSDVSEDIQVIDLYQRELNKDLLTQPTHSTQPTQPNLAYVIYTSGSTGVPRGVMIEHNQVINLVYGLRERIYRHYAGNLNIALVAPYIFDASVKQIFAALLQGHSLHIAGEEVRLDGLCLMEFYKTYQIDISDGTPAHLRLIKDSSEDRPKNYPGHFLIGGEGLMPKLVEGFRECYRSHALHVPRITNVYGPTECCVDSTLYEIPRDIPDPGETGKTGVFLPIGKPMPNQRVYIVNTREQLQPIGVPGELCIAGGSVGRGYLNHPELTSEKFDHDLWDYRDDQDKRKKIPGKDQKQSCNHAAMQACSHKTMQLSPHHSPQYPITPLPHSPIYRTGDLARWLADGNIEFLGRIDEQVKIRGFRIEMSEIEAQLLKHDNIKEVVVIVKQDQNEDKHPAAYFVSDHQPSIMELREHLANHLPAYMVPSFFIPMDFIPLTPNGKLDRKALESHDTHIHSEVEYIAPQTGLENTVAHIWQEVLGVDKVGINDNFFNIGGNSIKVIQLNAKLKAALKMDIPVAIMFRYLTIRSFVDYLNRKKGDEVFAGEGLDESIRLMEETNQLLNATEQETEEKNG